MTATRPSRLFIIKFLGLWGGQQQLDRDNKQGKLDHHKQHLQNGTGLSMSVDVDNNKTKNDDYNSDSYRKAIKASSRKISSFMLEKGTPGMIVCVSKKGNIVWETAFGFCDVENQLNCQPDSKMRIASISKPIFVASVVAPLIEQKKIDIKSSVHKYLSYDEFPKQKFEDKEYDLTIEQLLSHTSGIRYYNECKDEEKPLLPIVSKGSKKVYQSKQQYDKEEFYTRKTYRNVIDAISPFKDGPLDSKPGEYKYTTYGYTLLSAVMQKVHENLKQDENKTKVTVEQIEDYWIKVLRKDWYMKETYLDQDEVIIPNRSRYYMRTGFNGTLINAPYTDLSVKWAGGGIISSASDVVKFGNKLIDCYKERKGAILKRETIDLMWRQVKEDVALGFFVEKDKDNKLVVSHSGGALGASSMLIIYPESEIVVVMLTNMGEISLKELSLFIADQFENIN